MVCADLGRLPGDSPFERTQSPERSQCIAVHAGLDAAPVEKRIAGMASTVELFDGYQFEIAGSLQFPTSAVVSRALGLDTLPTVPLEVMSVSMRGIGDTPLIYYTDVMAALGVRAAQQTSTAAIW